MKPVAQMTQLELGAFIQSHLAGKGVEVVLSGEAAASLYTNNEYISRDLDFVNVHSVSRRKLADAMTELGFVEQNRYYGHPETEYIVEFPPGPLAIGGEPVKHIVSRSFPTGVLRLISPTDCVKDRLAGYFHFGDRQCLRQATLVVQSNEIDLEEVRRWSQREDKLAEFEAVRAALLSGRA